jgi:hypothetical protein
MRQVRFTRAVSVFLALALLGSVLAITLAAQAPVTSPEKFFGFQMGADKKMARWDKMVEYYQLLEKEGGGRLKVVNMGPTTEGNPFLLVIITSAANMAKLDRLREVNVRISDPRGLSEAEVKKLVAEGKAVVCQSMSLHATEIGGTQMAPELAYDLLSRRDEETQRILDNVVFLMVPSFNPDGEIMVADWYQKTLGTPQEGSSPPQLYHKYAGHDNNRDAFQTNLVESQYMAKILFREWIPQAYVDHHHMGSNGARIYIPPYAEPIRPYGDPLIWREMSWYGAHMAYKEEETGLSGVLNMAEYSGWGHFGFHWITPFHNIAGMLTESASAQLATPMYIHPDTLRGGARNLPEYEEQTNFPDPWPGGWWRLRDIIERQKVSAWAVLDLAARNRETVLWNAYQKAKRQTERGAAGSPRAYVIPLNQHDPLTAMKLANKLLIQGVEVKRAPKGFSASSGMNYAPGSFVVSLAQPKMGLLRYLLGRTFYPDNEWTRNRDGSPSRPYDMATDTMFEFMGVRVDPLDEPINADLVKLAAAVQPAGKVGRSTIGYALDGRLNDSFRAVNMLLEKGAAVRRVDQADQGLSPGDFIVAPGSETLLASIAKEIGVDFTPLKADLKQGTHDVKRLRIGLYQRLNNMDEGWTRLLLEQFNFPYTSVPDAEINKGNLNEKYDVIVFPEGVSGPATATTGGAAQAGGRGGAARAAGGGGRAGGAEAGAAEAAGAGAAAALGAGQRGAAPERAAAAETQAPERGGPAGGRGGAAGISTDGVAALRTFVEKGGAVVTFGSASTFAIDQLRLSVRNVMANVNDTKVFWCPGSTLHVKFDNTNPLAYGMPPEGLALYFNGNPAFEITSSREPDQYQTVVRYADRNLLESGWLVGEQALAKKSAMVVAKLGEGRVVLIGFRPQHRAQTHGTYKLVFNALIR